VADGGWSLMIEVGGGVMVVDDAWWWLMLVDAG
jgi:hypothetical protein